MSISTLRVNHCRNLSSIQIKPSNGFNLITGINGSGKSSLLESISLLGTGRSFRTRSIHPVIQSGQQSLTVHAQITLPSGRIVSVGMERGRQNQRLHIDQVSVQKLSQFAELLPLQVITPESIDLITGTPKQRRAFLDWGLFHVKPDYLPLYHRYRKTIRQRNALLRGTSSQRGQIDYWNQILIDTGNLITQYRNEYVDSLRQCYIEDLTDKISLLQHLQINFKYRPGWNQSLSFSDALAQSSEREIMVGHTVVGPQEADLLIQTEGESAKQRLSRGQAKLLSIGLYLAQLNHLAVTVNKRSVVLVDDLFSELDEDNSLAIFTYLLDSGYQVFASSADPLKQFSEQMSVTRFHVEQGVISKI